ncbi:hypothetical protein DSO57_1013775 [Entomophthora muscae]|uniref:Uncharacterized protein n=1 Tax=Entomophthora muscae TaxID=34485 RepID=A0ACC2S7L7_9FUNG|nr:hypothetical protein DSO57_1013775 [Entomophthora muscae]
MSIYTGQLLMECIYSKPGERLLSYPEIGEAAFGNVGKHMVQFLHYVTLLGVTCMYLVLIGKNMKEACEIIQFSGIGIREWVAIGGAAIIIPLILLRTLKEVAWLSLLGALATLYVVIITVVVSLKDIPRQLAMRGAPLNSSWKVINWSDLPSSLATISFSFGGNIIYPHVECSMRHPKQWTKVLAAAMATIAAMYGLIGIVAYYVYGDTVQSPIMMSLPKENEALSAMIIITVHIVLVLPITLCSFSLEAESKLGLAASSFNALTKFGIRSGIRIGTLAVLTVIAAFLPHFPELMSLIGAFSNCAVVFVIPIVCHLKLFGYKNRSFLEYVWILLVLAVASMGCFIGTVWAVRGLQDAVQKGSS